MKIRDVITESVDNELIKSFLPFAQKELGMKKIPDIKIVDEIPGAGGTTFGKYVNDTDTIYVVAKNRHPRDVLRTLAHELTHYIQDQENRLNHNSGETGSPEENEAHARGGIIMRNFNQAYPDIQEKEVDEHIVKHGSGYRLLSHKGKNLGDFPSHAAAAKHEGEVKWFERHPKNESK
jgi:hypothetical protein